jgi:hypothetical protein
MKCRYVVGEYMHFMTDNREPSKSSLDTPGPAVLEGPVARAASPTVALLDTLKSSPCVTKSHSQPPVPLLGWGPTPSTSTRQAPNDTPLAPSISCTGASHAFYVASFGTGVSCSATTSHGEPRGTMARSPTLTADDATWGKYGDVAKCSSG